MAEQPVALMLSGSYPCVRVGKIALAMEWEHDALSLAPAPQLRQAYRKGMADLFLSQPEYLTYIKGNKEAQILHVHTEPNWPAYVAGKDGRPVIFNVHDVTSARTGQLMDPWEEVAFESADALVFITEEQREFAELSGLPIDKPTVVLGNYPTRSLFLEPSKEKYGRLVYAGGVDKRGGPWRDISAVADAVDLHIYPGNPGLDYGIAHPTQPVYEGLLAELTHYEWGYAGSPQKGPGYLHAHPNKPGDYLSAGLPLVIQNLPLLKAWCDAGLGIYCQTVEEVKEAVETDPTPYREAVLAKRDSYSMEAHIGPLEDLYEELA